MTEGLTPRQRAALDFIEAYITTHQCSPSYREVMRHLGLASTGSVHKLLAILHRKGALTSERRCARSLSLARQPLAAEHTVRLPVVGYLVPGMPVETLEKHRYIAIPAMLAPHPDRSYILQIKGHALAEDHLLDKDWVVVQAQGHASDGDMILACIDKHETVARRYHPSGSYARLEPTNPHLAPLIVRTDSLSILGVILTAFRSFATS